MGEKRKKSRTYAEMLIHVGQKETAAELEGVVARDQQPEATAARGPCLFLSHSFTLFFSLFLFPSTQPESFVSFPLTRNFQFTLLHSTCTGKSDGKVQKMPQNNKPSTAGC